MEDNLLKAGLIMSEIDALITKINDTKDCFNAAQGSSGSKSMIVSKETETRPEFRKLITNLETDINSFLGAIV